MPDIDNTKEELDQINLVSNSYPILVIDDDQMIQTLFQKYLESWGFEVSSIYDPYEGVAEALKKRPLLIILDIYLPGLDGEKLLKLFRTIEFTSHVPIIIVSANLNMELLNSTHKKGASGFLSKPFTREELFVQIKKVISPGTFKRMKMEGVVLPEPPKDFDE